ncbi:MAG: hypothetical protein GXP62_00350 [Oligoflexia bacterium]|nr:hypothetical protein [Oligoflexia bacterium]
MIIWTLLAFSCGGYPPEDFALDMAAETCALYQSCDYLTTFGFASVDDCAATVQTSYDPTIIDCPTYDKNLATDCIAGVQQMSCDDLYASNWPQACAERCGYVGDGQLGDSTDSGGGTTTTTSSR